MPVPAQAASAADVRQQWAAPAANEPPPPPGAHSLGWSPVPDLSNHAAGESPAPPEQPSWAGRSTAATRQRPRPAWAPATVPPLWSAADASERARHVPSELWAVIAAFAFVGVFTCYTALRPLPSVADGFSFPSPTNRLFLVLAVVLVMLAGFGVACLAVAWMLFRADRVGRGLAYVLAGTLGIAALLSATSSSSTSLTASDGSGGTWRTVTMLVALGVVGVLALAPTTRAWFTGPQARQHDQPAAVVTAQMLVAVSGFVVGLLALLYLLVGSLDGKYYLIGLGLLTLAGGYVAVYRMIGARAAAGPVLAAVVSGAAAVLELLGLHSAAFLVGIGVQLAIPGLLWLSPEAVRHFGRVPTWTSGWDVATPGPVG